MSLEKKLRKVFQGPRKGETFELRTGLVSQYAHERKDAIQRTIAAMTLGKDVSALFPDILKNIATHDLEQKKLVYLYLMNYAKIHPELCILAVNTFVQDSEDPNPLVRALAIRTMGCIRVDTMVDYMNIPLRKTLADDNPYVRKTAAICVAKLFDLNPTLCVEEGFLSDLQGLMDDANPMVVANAVSALAEIQESAPETNCFHMNSAGVKKLLMALNECTEWGRIAILTSLSDYKTNDITEAEHITERVVPQFQHANPSVVLAAVRAVLSHLEIQSKDAQDILLKKMSSPLVTLVSCAPEVQYVALRNIRIILERYPQILSKELRVFFCKYNDPLYLKFEKLEIMVNLATDDNVGPLITELKEYAMEVDMDFVRRAIKAIGQCAIKIASAADKCVNVLLELMDNKVNYVIQEITLVAKDILRRYPQYTALFVQLSQSIEEIDEPESKAALIWMFGEFGENIDNVGEILDGFASNLLEESTQVQQQIITATVKLYMKNPDSGQTLIQKVLQDATSKSDNADVRDRAYMYWRLLSSDTSVAKEVTLAEKPPIDSTIDRIPRGLLIELLGEISTLASVYHKTPSAFLGKGKYGADAVQKRAIEELQQIGKEDAVHSLKNATKGENLLDLDFDIAGSETPDSTEGGATPPIGSSMGDLGDIFSSTPSPTIPSVEHSGATHSSGLDDLMGLYNNNPAPAFQAPTNTAVFGQIAKAPTSQAKPSSNSLDAFAGLDIGGSQFGNTSSNPSTVEKKSTSDDLLGLF